MYLQAETLMNDNQQIHEQVLMVGGKPKLVALRTPVQGEYVIIDAINVVCSVDTFASCEMDKLNLKPKQILALDLDPDQSEWLHNELLKRIGADLAFIFGDEFRTLISKTTSYLQYANGYTVYSAEREILLNVGIGGERQNNTVLFSLTGTGCKLAKDGWQQRLYDFLNYAKAGKITRIDLAHDDLEGKYSDFDWANEQETQDRFLLPKTRIRPACTIAGEFKHGDPLNKGLTLYVGSRKNGKTMRCYEKGKQLGDPNSKWFRSELEMHAKARLIPFEVLIKPTEFFCGAYPYCEDLVNLAKKHYGDHTPQTVETMPAIKRQAEISLNRAINILKNQFGKYIKVFGEIFTKNNAPDYQKIFNKLKSDDIRDYYPKRLKLTANYFKDSPIITDLFGFDLQKLKPSAKDPDYFPPEFLKPNGFALPVGLSP